MYTILGSGFGLYGYLPALVNKLGQEVILPRSYEEKINARQELACTLDKIHWVKNTDEALSLAKAVIIAVPPTIQPRLVKHCLTFPNITRFVLEKPLAISPRLASELINQLDAVKKLYVIGYSFINLSWQDGLNWPSSTSATITIVWDFMAHHFSNNLYNWKRFHAEGGGVLRFYGIQIIAILALRGYKEVRNSVLTGRSKEEPEIWHATFTGPNLPVCNLTINSRSNKEQFNVADTNGTYLLSITEPFENESKIDSLDRRVTVLADILINFELSDSSGSYVDKFKKINELWTQAEAK